MTPYSSGAGARLTGSIPRAEKPAVPRPTRLVLNEPDSTWRNRAACRDEDPSLFFPIGTVGPALLQIEDAKAVCARCPAREACLDWAMTVGEDHGVWGGLAEEERRALKRRIARTRSYDSQARTGRPKQPAGKA